jgi:hypothetical protein
MDSPGSSDVGWRRRGRKRFSLSLFGEAAKFLIFSCLAPILPNPHPPPAVSGFIVCLVGFFFAVGDL